MLYGRLQVVLMVPPTKEDALTRCSKDEPLGNIKKCAEGFPQV